MTEESVQGPWPDREGLVHQRELARICSLSSDEIEELVDYGLLPPVTGARAQHLFRASCVAPLRRAALQRARFDLDVFVAGLLFRQFEEIEQLEQQLRFLQAHLPHPHPNRDGPAHWLEPHG